MQMRSFFDAGLVFFTLAALYATLVIARTVRRPYAVQPDGMEALVHIGGAVLLAGAGALLVTGDIAGMLAAVFCALAAMAVLWFRLPQLSPAGLVETAVQPLFLLWSLPWTYFLLSEQNFPAWALALTLAGGVISLALLGFALAAKLARDAVLTHDSWERPNRPLSPRSTASAPMVSVHLPCYAEPPEVVQATMDHLAALDYSNYEVLVCDNNTRDEALWVPLREHAARLNRRLGRELFRFFHVAPLEGAKAGALNYLIERMAPETKLVAVLDADYLAEPDFLSRLVGFFDDAHIGYVQTPHDYRDYATSPYLRSCYWEYTPTNKVVYPGINEYHAPFTIGTMCVVRAAALREVGGWAEWCLTEDSELSIRLRAIGYNGIYLRDTFGRGLIPEAFEDYKKQRFRWTAGPVQQLRRYWRLYLPEKFGGARSGLNGWSKLLELQRSASPLLDLVSNGWAMVVGLATVVLTTSGALPAVTLPSAAWVALFAGSGAACVGLWHRYRLSGCARISDMARAELAKASLTYVQMVAGLAGLSSRPRAWTRTPKFGAQASGLRALAATLPEIGIGVAHLALIGVVIAANGLLGSHTTILISLTLLISAARFFAAPVMSILSELHIAGLGGPVPTPTVVTRPAAAI